MCFLTKRSARRSFLRFCRERRAPLSDDVRQMLNFAANAVVYWPVEQIRAAFERNCDDPKGRLAEFLGGR